jgi:hypothetical protein
MKASIASASSVAAGLAHHHQQRPFLPLRVRHADHRRLQHRRVAHGEVLQFDRADPFAAGLDHVLAAVGQLDVAVGAMVARSPVFSQPWSSTALPPSFLKIGIADPRRLHAEVADGLAILRQFIAGIVDQPVVDAPGGMA